MHGLRGKGHYVLPLEYSGFAKPFILHTSSFVPCECLPLVGGVVERADGAVALGGHEADDGEEGGADGPGGLPRLGMVAGDGEAYLLVRLEAAVRLRK